MDKRQSCSANSQARYSLDVIGELFFGRMFGFMQGSYDHESLIEALDTLLPVLTMSCVAAPLYRPFITISAAFSSSKRKAIGVMTRINKTALRMVQRRRKIEAQEGASGLTRRDILKQLLDIVKDKGEKTDFGFGDVAYAAHGAL